MDTAQRTPRCEASLAAAFAVPGKRWTGVLIGALTEGDAGFAELRRGVDGEIIDFVLSARLTELIGCGLIERVVVDGPPGRRPVPPHRHRTSTQPRTRELGSWAQTYLLDEQPPSRE